MPINVERNKDNLYVPKLNMLCESTKDLPYIPSAPLRTKNFFYYICGAPKSGKSVLWFNMLHSHKTPKHPDTPVFYFKFFDKVYLFSNSIDTLDSKKLKVHDDRRFHKYDGDTLCEILDTEKASGENNNCCFVFDDVIKDIQSQRKHQNKQILSKMILNRRHICHNPDTEKVGGVSVMVISQKYNLLDTEFRNAISDLIIFRTNNRQELDTVWREYAHDLSWDNFKKLTKYIWDAPHNFMLIKTDETPEHKYYKNFDKIILSQNMLDSDDEEDT
jgi:hypothetical protein